MRGEQWRGERRDEGDWKGKRSLMFWEEGYGAERDWEVNEVQGGEGGKKM